MVVDFGKEAVVVEVVEVALGELVAAGPVVVLAGPRSWELTPEGVAVSVSIPEGSSVKAGPVRELKNEATAGSEFDVAPSVNFVLWLKRKDSKLLTCHCGADNISSSENAFHVGKELIAVGVSRNS